MITTNNVPVIHNNVMLTKAVLLACIAAGRVTKSPVSIVRLRNGSQKLVLTPRMDTRICVSISDWLVSYTPCDWSYSCEIYYAMLKINIVVCVF